MHADSAIHAIVNDNEYNVEVILLCGRNFLAVHQKITVTGEGNDWTVRMDQSSSNAGWHAVAH